MDVGYLDINDTSRIVFETVYILVNRGENTAYTNYSSRGFCNVYN
jgi:hypothetical protein